MKSFWNVRFARVLGIIALVAVIGFSMAACGGNDDGGGGGGDDKWVGKWVNVNDSTDYFTLKADKSWIIGDTESEHGYGSEWRYDKIGLGTGPCIVLVYTSVLGGTAGYYLRIEGDILEWLGYGYGDKYKKQ